MEVIDNSLWGEDLVVWRFNGQDDDAMKLWRLLMIDDYGRLAKVMEGWRRRMNMEVDMYESINWNWRWWKVLGESIFDWRRWRFRSCFWWLKELCRVWRLNSEDWFVMTLLLLWRLNLKVMKVCMKMWRGILKRSCGRWDGDSKKVCYVLHFLLRFVQFLLRFFVDIFLLSFSVTKFFSYNFFSSRNSVRFQLFSRFSKGANLF